MAELMNYGRDLVANSGLPGTLYVALSTTTPSADGSGVTEPSGGGYARLAVTMGAASGRDGLRENTGAIQFAPSGADWGSINTAVLYDALSGGNAVAYDEDIGGPFNLVDGSTLDFGIGDIDVDVN